MKETGIAFCFTYVALLSRMQEPQKNNQKDSSASADVKLVMLENNMKIEETINVKKDAEQQKRQFQKSLAQQNYQTKNKHEKSAWGLANKQQNKSSQDQSHINQPRARNGKR